MSIYPLELTYEEFLKNQKSIANTRIDNFIVYEKLGSGSFGSVYRGMNDTTKREVAIKVLDLVAIDREESSSKVKEIRRRLAKTESELMMKVDSEHVMKLYSVYENKNLKIMVIEYCNGGPLSQELLSRGRIPEKESIEIVKQIILGLAEMHRMNIVHRDLKTDNIMSHNGIYKIIDLGFARIMPHESEVQGTVLGTIITMAPEVMKREKYGLKADVWSIGVILYEMIYGRLPYEPMKSADMYEQIIKKDIFPNGGKVNGLKPSNEAVELMKKLLTIDQRQRIGWDDLISEKLFQDKENLCEEYRITVSVSKLKKQAKIKPDEIQEDEFLKQLENLKVEDNKVELNKVKVQKLTPEESKKKGGELDRSEENIVKWAMANHLECLKTELILKEIIIPIESKNILNLESRKVIEFLYLLSSRCFFNMSFVLNDFVNSNNPIVNNLKNNVESLYGQVSKKFEYYSGMLTKQENKWGSILKDRVSKILDSKEFQNKDKFLIGIENIEFKKEEQILYTYNNYIKEIMDQIAPKSIKLKAKLKNYKEIVKIEEKDIKDKKFHEVVEQIVKKDESQ